MALPEDSTFGTFADGGELEINDIVVGLRNGVNTRFSATGFPGIYLPLAGGTMAGAVNMAATYAITGLPAPSASTDAVNKAYADALVAGAALTRVNDTNVTLALGGTPTTSLLDAVSLTLGWTGELAVTRGGTGAATFTAYSVLCAGVTDTGALQNVSGLGTSGQVLISQGAGALPEWGDAPGTGTVDAGTINQLAYYAATGTAVSGLATANSGVLVTSAGGVPSISSTLPAFTTSAITFNPTTGGIVGTTTNNNADAGKVGELIESVILVGSAVALTTATTANVTSISLTAGDWDVWGVVNYALAASTVMAGCTGCISNTSATNLTVPGFGSYFQYNLRAGNELVGATNLTLPYGSSRISLSATTTIYLTARANFTTSTMTAFGGLYARRRR